MKARELMIGDWVSYIGDGEPKPKQVMEITSLDQVKLWDDSDFLLVDEKYIKPITLTDEILTANNFYFKQNLGYYYEDGEYEIIVSLFSSKYRILYNHDVVVNIECFWDITVHELQHAIKLVGIDKELKLEK